MQKKEFMQNHYEDYMEKYLEVYIKRMMNQGDGYPS